MDFTVSSGSCDVPPGMYRAPFVRYEETAPHPEFGRGVKFAFKIDGGEEATRICSIEKPPTARNSLGRILSGLLGRPLEVGERLNVDACIGKQYLIQVEAAPGGNGSRVSTVMPAF